MIVKLTENDNLKKNSGHVTCFGQWNVSRVHHFSVKTFFSVISFLLNLLGWHYLIKLYKFQVYTSIIHLCIVLCVHRPKSSLLPSPYPLLPTPTRLHYLLKVKTKGNLGLKDWDLMGKQNTYGLFYRLGNSIALQLAHLRHPTNMKCQIHSNPH